MLSRDKVIYLESPSQSSQTWFDIVCSTVETCMTLVYKAIFSSGPWLFAQICTWPAVSIASCWVWKGTVKGSARVLVWFPGWGGKNGEVCEHTETHMCMYLPSAEQVHRDYQTQSLRQSMVQIVTVGEIRVKRCISVTQILRCNQISQVC